MPLCVLCVYNAGEAARQGEWNANAPAPSVFAFHRHTCHISARRAGNPTLGGSGGGTTVIPVWQVGRAYQQEEGNRKNRSALPAVGSGHQRRRQLNSSTLNNIYNVIISAMDTLWPVILGVSCMLQLATHHFTSVLLLLLWVVF